MPTERRDLGALEKAVNDAAGRANSLWVSFILFATLLVITTGTVTHKDLLLELPLKLPVLNVDLPLIDYFIAVPLFFVVFHFYVLLQLDGLAGKIKDYNDALNLNAEEPFEANRRLLRQRLDTFIFAQLLVRARERRECRVGVLNRSVVWITMVALPIGTLLELQLIFLAYHHEAVTWWHRFWVAVELFLVWFFWHRVARLTATSAAASHIFPRSLRAAHRLRRLRKGHRRPKPKKPVYAWRFVSQLLDRPRLWSRHALLAFPPRWQMVLGASVLLFATLVAVYPTERIYGSWIRAPASYLTLLLLEGEPNKATGVPNSWLGSNRLVLPAADFGVEEKLVAWSKNVEALAALAKVSASIAPLSTPHPGSTLSLRGRDLSFAAFDRSDPPFR